MIVEDRRLRINYWIS
jgi:hypothetical protein